MKTEERVNWLHVKDAVNTQARVIYALMMRETLSRYGDHKLGFVWAILEPLFMVSIVVAFVSAMGTDSPGGMPIVPFMITGFVPFFMFRNTMNQLRTAIVANRNLLGFPQVTTFDVIIARMLLENSVLMVVFVFILSMAYLLGYEFSVENPLGVLAVILCIAGLGTGFGFMFAAITPIMPSIGQISSLVMGRPLLLTSGLFYVAESIPEPFRTWLLYNPLLHYMELIRSYFFYEFESNYGSWSYAGSWTFAMLVLGVVTHQALRRRAIVGL